MKQIQANQVNKNGKLKPFKLVKYFIVIGLAVIFIAGVVITTLDNHWLRSMQRRQNSNYAKVMLENLNHQIINLFIFPVVVSGGEVRTSNPEQHTMLDQVVRNTLHSYKVTAVNIYSMDRVIYSWDPDLVGRQIMVGEAIYNAFEGHTTEVLVEKGSSWSMLFGGSREVAMVLYAPLRMEVPYTVKATSQILNVIEIHLDVSSEYREISMIEILVSTTSIALILGFFAILIFVVHRGEVIINHRAKAELALRERLGRAEKLAALGELTSSISHEIRNPLGIIRSTASMLKKRMNKIDSDSSLPDIIVEESKRLNDILTDFINFARPRDTKMHRCRIDEIINKNISFLEPRLLESGGRIDMECISDLPEIYADEAMLYQAFLNVFMNALQANEADPQIRVTLSAGNGSVMLFVDDNGPGVPPDLMERIWDPFFTTKEQGTGLGLGIVKNIIEAHAGEIHIYNLEEQGARVEIILPASDEPAEPEENED